MSKLPSKPNGRKRVQSVPAPQPVLAPIYMRLDPLWIDGVDPASDEAAALLRSRVAQLVHRAREVSEARPHDAQTRRLAAILQALFLADTASLPAALKHSRLVDDLADFADSKLPELGAATPARERARHAERLELLIDRHRDKPPAWLAWQFMSSVLAHGSYFRSWLADRNTIPDFESAKTDIADAFERLNATHKRAKSGKEAKAYVLKGLALVGYGGPDPFGFRHVAKHRRDHKKKPRAGKP